MFGGDAKLNDIMSLATVAVCRLLLRNVGATFTDQTAADGSGPLSTVVRITRTGGGNFGGARAWHRAPAILVCLR